MFKSICFNGKKKKTSESGSACCSTGANPFQSFIQSSTSVNWLIAVTFQAIFYSAGVSFFHLFWNPGGHRSVVLRPKGTVLHVVFIARLSGFSLGVSSLIAKLQIYQISEKPNPGPGGCGLGLAVSSDCFVKPSHDNYISHLSLFKGPASEKQALCISPWKKHGKEMKIWFITTWDF